MEEEKVAKDEVAAKEEEPEFDLDENGVWRGVCLDDGTGRDICFVDTRGIRSRREPPGYTPERFENGDRRYYFRQKCIRCRKVNQPAIFVAHNAGATGFSLNYCEDCHISSTGGITRVNVNGDSIWASNADTPKSAWFNLKKSALDPKRDEIILERCVDARYSVRHDMKKSRNRMRYHEFKSQASLYDGIDLMNGQYISWGFEDTFDEYFGEVNERGEPTLTPALFVRAIAAAKKAVEDAAAARAAHAAAIARGGQQRGGGRRNRPRGVGGN